MSRPFRSFCLACLLGLLLLVPPATAERAVEEESAAKPKRIVAYEKIAARYSDDVEGNWALAEWCKRQRLATRRKQHLRRVLELEPDHAGARRALRYVRRGDRWLTREQSMTSRGYVRYRGRWILPQQRDLLVSKKRQSVETKQWMRKVKLWISYSQDRRPRLQEQGLANLRAIEDPAALGALDRLLGEQEDETYRLLLVEILSNIDDPKVTSQLIARSLTDPSGEVRSRAVDLIVRRSDLDALEKYKRALHSKDNVVVRRAAVALSEFEDVSVVPALIEALVTTHKVRVFSSRPSGFGFSSTTVSPSGLGVGTLPGTAQGPIILPSTGGIGLGYGGKAPKMARVEIRNNEALFALNKLTGKNFSFDKDAWRLYWETERRRTLGAPVLQPQRYPSTAPLRPATP